MKMNRLLEGVISGVMLFVCACLFPAGAATLKVEIKGGAVNVTAPAYAIDDTSKLYLVWDTEDHGDDLSSWPTENRAIYSGAVSSAAATYTFDAVKLGIPVASKVRAFAVSDIRLIDGWVSLGNGQYIDTGIKGNEAYGVDFKYLRTGTSHSYAPIIGSTTDNFTIGRFGSDKKFYLRYRERAVAYFEFDDTTVPHTFGIIDRKCYMDGVPFKEGLDEGAIGTDVRSIIVGSANTPTGPAYYCYGKWHYVRVLGQDGGDLCHLAPAVRGNDSPVAGFYDTVSGKFFANSGTGAIAYDTAASVTNTIENVIFSDTASIDNVWAYKTALWTGNGDRQNVNDPNNWSLTDLSGNTIAAAPDIYTFVKIEGATSFNVPVGQTLSCAAIDFDNVSLSTDCDWRGLAAPVLLTYLDAPKGSYIDTGFNPNNNTRVVFDVTVRGTLESWFGITDDTSGYWWKTSVFGVSNDGSSVYSGWGNSGGGGGDGSVVSNGRHTIDFDKGVLKVDGEIRKTHPEQTFQLSRSLYLFADHRPNDVNIKNNDPAIRFHSCKIYDNGTLVRDYVPVRVVDGTVCLYDRCTKSCVYNAGSGALSSDDAGTVLPAAIFFDGSINLAGHKLMLAHTIGSGTITDTVGGELWIDVPAGSVTENASLSFTGLLKLVKDGAGSFVAAKADQTYTGGTVVTNGWAKSGAYNGAWGPAKALITIAHGAAFDWAGKVNDNTQTPYSFVIAGDGPDGAGAMISSVAVLSGSWWQMDCIADMELSGDATIAMPNSQSGIPGFMYKNANDIHNLILNGHTLTIRHGSRMSFRCVKAIGPGTIANVDYSGSNTDKGISVYGGDDKTDFSSVTLDIGPGCAVNAENTFTVGTFIDRRSEKGWGDDKMMTILDCFRPMTANLLKTVTLGNATHLSPVLDLSELNAPFMLPSSGCSMNMAEGATIKIKVGNRRISRSSPVIAWSSENPPDSVGSLTFALDDDERYYVVKVRKDGVYLSTGFVITVQ